MIFVELVRVGWYVVGVAAGWVKPSPGEALRESLRLVVAPMVLPGGCI